MDKIKYNFYANDKLAYFVDHVMIPDNKRGKMGKIELHGWKQQTLHSEKILIKKMRQVGLTELIAAEIAYNLNFKNHYDMMYIGLNSSMVTYVRDKIIRHYSYIPDSIQNGNTATNNKFKYATTNGSSITLSGESSVIGRSRTFNAIYMEEVDHYRNFHDCYLSLVPCLAIHNMDTKLLISTTPSSSFSYFYDLWNNNANGFDTLELTLSSGNILKNTKEKRKKTLNDITKTAYSKIIRECTIS